MSSPGNGAMTAVGRGIYLQGEGGRERERGFFILSCMPTFTTFHNYNHSTEEEEKGVDGSFLFLLSYDSRF